MSDSDYKVAAGITESGQEDPKYILIRVDNFAQTGQSSYLRLGAIDSTVAAAYVNGKVSSIPISYGEDLASMVTSFLDDDRARDGYPHQRDYTDPLGAYGTLTDAASRGKVTSELHTRGGWRDHSDGNRISTTRGDKVEVIRGNYRMLVLGRQDTADNGHLIDSSGGMLVDNDLAPGQITDIRWEKDSYSGTWKVFEETTKGNVVTRYHGDVQEFYFGGLIEKTIGSAHGYQVNEPGRYDDADRTMGRHLPGGDESDPSNWQDPDGHMVNPVIVERTWAREIAQHYGSADKRVHDIIQDYHVHNVRENWTLTGVYKHEFNGWMREAWMQQFDEIFLGGTSSVKMGAFFEFRLAAALEMTLAYAMKADFGFTSEIHMKLQELHINTHTEIATSDVQIKLNQVRLTYETRDANNNVISVARSSFGIYADKSIVALKVALGLG